MHGLLGLAGLLGLVAFAFGERAARTLAQILIIGTVGGFILFCMVP